MAKDNPQMMIQLNKVSKTIKKKELVETLSFSLEKGKILALCGGNGAGKSTLIRMITGLIRPTSGSILINGLQKKKDPQAYSKQFGYMPDDFNFQKAMTTKETIAFYANIKNIDKERYEIVLKTVGLYDRLHDKVGSFSKGMTQRLLLAQALLARPDLLILDEPTNGLDPYWISKLAELMKEARKKGQTIIFSTHDLHIAEEVADEVMFLSNGKVISHGPIANYKALGLHETFQQLYFENIQAETIY